MVELKHYTPLQICSDAIRECWQSQDKSDNLGPKDKELIKRVACKFKHSSTLEHITYNFRIEGISRAVLQELARHRMTNLSVKSTRYTLKELKNELPFTDFTTLDDQTYLDDGLERAKKYLVLTSDIRVNRMSILALDNLRDLLNEGISNDIAKYALPEAYKTSLAWTINARSLQNFLELRTSKSALWEIRNLAFKIFDALPEGHKYLFEDIDGIGNSKENIKTKETK